MSEEPKQYRKKPVVITAMQVTGEPIHAYQWAESLVGSFPFPDKPDDEYPDKGVSINPATGNMVIATLEGLMTASTGDYLIRGVQGEFYPCKPDIFEQSYEEV